MPTNLQRLDATLVALNTLEAASEHATFWTEEFQGLSVNWEMAVEGARVYCMVAQRRPDEYAWSVDCAVKSKIGECSTTARAIKAALAVARDLLEQESRRAREKSVGGVTGKVRRTVPPVRVSPSGRVGRNR